MPANRVLQLLELLSGRGLDVWVDGGWGVDALVGRQTRVHEDLDLGVVRQHLDPAIEVLAEAGYAVTDARFIEVTVQLADASRQRLDLHPSTALPGGGTEQVDFEGDSYYIPPAVDGRIDGQLVRCAAVGAQLRAHEGYRLRPKDRHDLELLRQLRGGAGGE